MNGIASSLYGDDVDMAKIMFGVNAAHVPVNLTIQRMDSGIVLLVGASRFGPASALHPLMYGSLKTHVKIVGDLVIRPAWVGETDALVGSGAAGLLTGSSFADPAQWTTILGEAPVR